MKPIRVFLDTEPLRRDPARRSAHFEALTHLAERELVALHISQLSVREFSTSIEAELGAVASTLADEARTLKRFASSLVARAYVQDHEKLTNELLRRLRLDSAESLQSWLDKCAVTVHEVDGCHLKSVLDSYFAGDPPFAKIKNRADFPDAFIGESLREVASAGEQVCFVSGDQRLRSAASGMVNVAVFESIGELLKTPELSSVLGSGVLESQLALIEDAFEAWMAQSESAKAAVAKELYGRRVLFFYPLEGHYQVARVESVNRVVEAGKPVALGEGNILIAFSGFATCLVDAVQVAEPRPEGSSLTISRELVFGGALRFSLPADVLGKAIGTDRLLDALIEAEVEIDELTIHWEEGKKSLPAEVFQRLAMDEAQRQLRAGDLEVELDEDEERDRLSRARWVDLPESFHGTHGKFTIREGAKFKISPMQRFEHWVRTLKRVSIDREGTRAANADSKDVPSPRSNE